MNEKSTSSLSPCGQLVRQQDPDRFLAALFAPAAQRERLFTLLAFNQEIARIRDSVREPIMGQIRLQWWREGLEAAVPPPHDVLKAVHALQLDRAPLLQLIDAREQDMAEEPPETVDAIEAYARATSAPLLRAMGGVEADDIATGYALTGLLRSGRFPAQSAALMQRAAELLQTAGRGQAALWRALALFYLKKGCPADPHPLRGWVLLWAFWRS